MKRDRYSGKIINERYELLRLIDEGGMGAVYLGRDLKLGRKAAVKFLHSELTAGEASVKRFYREAQAASAVYHPNIISIFDVGVSEWGEPYLVMEYLTGETLAGLLKRRKTFDSAAALGVLEPALRGLGAAHEQSIIHRDLKPENIFVVRIPDGAPIVKLIDFGISKFSESDQPQLTRTGALLGTPSYMSPEQARGKGEFDQRSDLYSIGVILYLMLSGDHPFVGQSYNDLIINILTEPPRDPFLINPNFPRDLAPIVQKLLEKEPDKRYPDCKAVLAALETLEAYGKRQAALADLALEMPAENFATGDLGDGEFKRAEKEPDDLAATVFAKMGPDDKPSKEVPPAVSDTAVPPIETQEMSWDSIPSRIPPPRRRSEERRSPWPTILMLVILFAAGIAVVLGADLLYSSDTTATDQDEETAALREKLTSMQENTQSSTDLRTDSTAVVNGADAESSENTTTETKLPDSDSSTDAPKDTVDSAEGAIPALAVTETDGAADLTASVNPPDTRAVPPPKNSVPGESERRTTSENEKPSAVSGKPDKEKMSGETTDLPPNLPASNPSSVEPESVSPNPFESGPNPFESGTRSLSPQKVDRLVDAESSRIQNCYDMARISAPTLSGQLELVVGMAGEKVQVSVQKNELTPYLASCVERVILSITPPPNDGTLVEILKEFNFRTAE